jgi:hypothetical protein
VNNKSGFGPGFLTNGTASRREKVLAIGFEIRKCGRMVFVCVKEGFTVTESFEKTFVETKEKFGGEGINDFINHGKNGA